MEFSSETRLSKHFKLKEFEKSQMAYRLDIEIVGIDNETLFAYIKNELDFDQVILEYYDGITPDSGWIHVSYVSPEENRKNSFAYDGINYRVV